MNTIERLPVDIRQGAGCRLIDADGKSYLDFWGDEGVASLGYCSPIVQDVFRTFANNPVPHRLPDAYPNELRTRAAAALTRAARYDQVFFCNSGAEANEAALKLARRYWSKVHDQPERYRILTVEGNFHGRTGYALAASDSIDSPYHKQGYGPTPPGFGVIHDDLDINRVRVWNGEGYQPAKSILGLAGDQIEMTDWSKIAAVTMAPILGNNVVKTYPKAFWDRLSALREAHGFLVIFDEVQVAMGRTGEFCAHHNPMVTFGFRPDIICIGKGIAGGLPAATILADDEVAQAFVPGVHFSTFGATLIVCEMMLEVIAWIENNYETLAQREEQFIQNFEALKQQGLITAYDGAGIHWGFTPAYDTGKYTFTGMDVCNVARPRGLLMLTHRPKAPIRFTPPLNISAEELGEAFNILEDALQVLTSNDGTTDTVG